MFNVPSADILEKGQTYLEFDASYKQFDNTATFTPRIVQGVGGHAEIGLNVAGLGKLAVLQTTLVPTLKYKMYDGKDNGWGFLVGDSLSIPVQNQTYDLGNYVYAEFDKSWKTQSRLTFGLYHFTPNVVATGQRAGGQFALEQPVNSHVTVAADWFTGNSAVGYFTPGIIVKITRKLTWYGCYQIGNRGALEGNHQFLTEFGWTIR